MKARVDRVADPFAATGRGDIRKILARCCAHLLELVQYVGSRLFQKRSPLLPHFYRICEFDAAGVVWHFADNFQRRVFTLSWLKVDPKGLSQLQFRDA